MAVAVGLLAASAACAQAPGAPAASPEVKALVGQVAAAYKSLNSFGATIETTSGSGEKAQKIVSTLVFQKPGKLSATIQHGSDTSHVVADGKNLYADSSTDKATYVKQPVGTFSDIVQQLQRSQGAGIGLLPILLVSENAEQQLIPGPATKQEKGADETVDGVACDVLSAELGTAENGAKFSFAFGKQDHLLRRLTIVPLKAGATDGITETYTGVTTTPAVTDATFSYTPPAGAKAVDRPAEPLMYDARIKPGASPLPFSGTDLDGKPVSLAAYKGKVLLIDFWATWCGPCVGELPNVIKAYNKYHAQGFDIVGVSLDNAPDKAKLRKFIKDQKMPWRQIFDGKGWESANAKAWGVQAIPFTVLLGKDGKIAAVGARGPALEPAIKAALAKK
jgi:outer membrane lipoprotein-sorting protein/peroxiredoxin